MPESNQPPPLHAHPQPEEDELSLIDLWNIVWKRKRIILVLGPLFGVIGIFYALSKTEIYRAEATLAPTVEEKSGGGLAALAGQFGGLASMAGINIGGGGSTETAIATLKSRQFLIQFLSDEKRQILFPNQWNPETKTWTVSSSRRAEDNRPTDLESYDRFTKGVLNISSDKNTGLVTLAIELPNIEATAAWANELTERLNAYLRQQAKDETDKNLAYLEAQLKKTQVLEIRESLYTLIEAESKAAMLANAKKEYAFKVIDPALVPEIRIRPKRALIVITSGMLGGFFGIFFCFVLHFVDTAKKAKN